MNGEAHAELNAQVCFCHSHKEAGDAFCIFCWRLLPMHMRAELARRLKGRYSNEYETFISSAKAFIVQQRASVLAMRESAEV